MIDRELSITIDNKNPIAIMKLSGFMGQLEVYKLKSQVEQLLTEAARFIVIDLSAVSFIDSAGLGSLTQIRGLCMAARGQMVLVIPMVTQVKQAIEVSSLQRVIEFFTQAEAAVDYLRSKHGLPGVASPQVVQEGRIEELAARISTVDGRLEKMEDRLGRIERLLMELKEARTTLHIS